MQIWLNVNQVIFTNITRFWLRRKKTHFPFSQKLNTLSHSYKALQLAYIWNYFHFLKAKGQDNLQDTKIDINLYIH